MLKKSLTISIDEKGKKKMLRFLEERMIKNQYGLHWDQEKHINRA